MSSPELHAQSLLDAEDAAILKALIGGEVIVSEYCEQQGTQATRDIHAEIVAAIEFQKRQMRHGQ